MKKKKIIIRIVAIVLVVMLIGGVIAAVASVRADELDTSGTLDTEAISDTFISAEDANAITLTNEYVAATGIAKGGDGLIYVADSDYNCIYSMTKDGELTLACGAQGISGNTDGLAADARFAEIFSICTYKKGIAITDKGNNTIRYFDGTSVTTIAGDGLAISLDGKGKNASFDMPSGITCDGLGNLYVTELNSGKIRKIDSKLRVSTLAIYKDSKANMSLWVKIEAAKAKGKSKVVKNLTKKLSVLSLNEPAAILYGKSGLYVADSANHRVLLINANGFASLVAGAASEGFVDASGSAARFSNPSGLALKGNSLFVADTGNSSVRRINLKNGKVSTFVEGYTLNNGLSTASPRGLAVIGGRLYIGDLFTMEVLGSK